MKLIKVLMGKRFPDIVYDNLFSNCRHSDKSYIGYISRSKYTPEYIFMKIIDMHYNGEYIRNQILNICVNENAPENVLMSLVNKNIVLFDDELSRNRNLPFNIQDILLMRKARSNDICGMSILAENRNIHPEIQMELFNADRVSVDESLYLNYFTSEEVIKSLLYRHEKSPIIYENILIRIRGKRYAFLDKAYRGVPRSA